MFVLSGTVWNAMPSLSTTEAYDIEMFSVGTNYYLAVAENKAGANGTVSEVYRWTGSAWTLQSVFPTSGARDIDIIQYRGEIYAAVAQQYDQVLYNSPSQLFHWNSGLQIFESMASVPYTGNSDWEFVTIGGNIYLMLSTTGDSFLYKLNVVKAKLFSIQFAVFFCIIQSVDLPKVASYELQP